MPRPSILSKVFLMLFCCSVSMLQAKPRLPPLHRRHLLAPFDLAGRMKVPVIFMDADSTLRIAPSGSVSANGPDDYIILPFVASVLTLYPNHLKVIVSNQQGIGKKLVKLRDADEALYRLITDLKKMGVIIHYMDYATRNARDRKPDTGMARRLEFLLKAEFGDSILIDKDTSFMVGDSDWTANELRPDGSQGQAFSNSDRRFAENYGIRFIPADEFFLWNRFGFRRIDTVSDYRLLADRIAGDCRLVLKNLERLANTP